MADERYIVINHEEQYAMWREGQPLPRGWRAVGRKGDKSACLNYIEEVWTDMTPRERANIRAGRLPR